MIIFKHGIDKFEYQDSFNPIIKSFIIEKQYNRLFINYNINDSFFKNRLFSYYDNKFIWNIVKNKLIIDENFIEDIENTFFKNIPNYTDLYNNKICNYDNIRGKFIQVDKQFLYEIEKRWIFKYIPNDNDNQIIYRELVINKSYNEMTIWISPTSNTHDIFHKKLQELKIINFRNKTQNDSDTKKIWNMIKNDLITIDHKFIF